jgi:hypothetical protein
VDYLLADFAAGTLGWAEFERAFHSFATLAKEVVPRRLMVLYPHVPFSGSYPLQPINDWMRRIAGPHTLALSPATWEIRSGQRLKQADAPWGEIARAQVGPSGTLLETRPYYTGDGQLDLTIQVACESRPTGSQLGTLQIVDVVTHQIVGQAPLKVPGDEVGWRRIPVRLTVNGAGDHSIQFRVHTTGVGAFSIGTIDLAVDYGIEVIDLADRLNTFDTHASIFDAHPNKRAHAVIAQAVLETLGTVKPTR